MQISLNISRKECELVHEQSLRLLSEMGVTVLSNEAVECFKMAGGRVENQQVFLEEKIVEAHLKYLPKYFTLCSNKRKVVIGKGEICTMPAYGGTYVSRNGEITLGNREDFVNFTKLNQSNKYIKMSCPYNIEPFDIPVEYREVYRVAMALRYSDKPTFSAVGSGQAAARSIDFVKNYWDIKDKYLLLGNVNVSAPLIMGYATAETIMVHAKKNQPIMIACGSGLSGLTAPPTPGGNYLLANAAILAGIVLSQILQPGLPVVYGFPLFGVNPVKAETLVGGYAAPLFTLMAKGMADYYRIPFRAGGNFTDSKILDYQSGYESCLNLFSCLLGDVDCLMHTFGMEDALKTVNYNKYILDEGLYEILLNYLKGFEINDVTLMTDEILRTGSTGNYISWRNLKLIRKQYKTLGFGEGKTIEETLESTDREIKKRLDAYEFPESSKAQLKILKGYLPNEYID